MAKKTTKKSPVRSKKSSVRSKKSPKTPKKQPKNALSGVAGQGNDLLPEQYATMWLMRGEGASLREIADVVGCNPRTVGREFERDPARHAALARVLAEERAAKWRQIEHRSIDLLVRMMDEIKTKLWTPTGQPRKMASKTREEMLLRFEILRKMIGPVRMAADSSTKMSQLLTGGPTHIVGGQVQTTGLGVDPLQMTPEESIRFASDHGLIHDLPEALLEKAAKMAEAGEIPKFDPDGPDK